LEQVIVTGSRVKRPEYEGNIPGVQTGAEQIDARNFTNAVEVLNDIPLVGGGATPNGTNGGQAASIGASFIDLLDLGTSRTLTLINSRRAVSGNAGSLFVFGNETGTQVDVNIIPTDLIERVDVLTVGGAVAYGSDAIAGVVNLGSLQLDLNYYHLFGCKT
jgi:outer membrane receptor protein involved in Fe transport